MDASPKAVFLSYSSDDSEPARRICETLRAAGIEVWFDQNELQGGDAWDAEIRKRIRDCALFVPIVSTSTNARGEGYFRLEWKLAVDRSHLMADDRPFLLPVSIDDTREVTARVPDRFRDVQWTRLPGGEDAEPFAKLARRLLESSPAKSALGAVIRGMPSIAVLPFANLGGDPGDEYFADGLTEDLITDISRLSRMSVAARHAVGAYKGNDVDVARVAKELGVQHVLVGSVRRSGERVRLNVQLVDPQTGRHVWTQRYDRALVDLFDVQDEMTRAIVSELEVRIAEGPQALSWQRGTANPVALDYFRRSRAAGVAMTLPSFIEALGHLRRAVEIDPSYARARAGVAAVGMGALMSGLATGQSELLAECRGAAEEALRLDPDLAEGWIARGQCLVFDGKAREAEEAARQALRLGSDANIVVTGAARIHLFIGQLDTALDLAQQIAGRSRKIIRHPAIVIGLASILVGRHDDALASVEPLIRATPGNPLARLILAAALVALGRPAEACEHGAQLKSLLRGERFETLARWMLPFVDPAPRERIVSLLRGAQVQ